MTSTSASGSFQLPTTDSAIGRLKTSYQSPLVRSNCSCFVLLFVFLYVLNNKLLKPSALPGASWLVCEGYYLSFAYFHSINSLDFCIQLCFSFFYFYHPFKRLCVLTHTHVIHCRITPNLVDNSYAIAKYDFDNPIYQAEDESEEDCEVPGELARLLQQEERVIQPHEEQVEVVNLGTDEDKKEIKIGAGLENSVK